MKRKKLVRFGGVFMGMIGIIILGFLIFFQRNLRTAVSVRKLEDGLYSVTYKGNYGFDAFIEQGGASDDMAVAEFVIRDMFHGLLSLDLKGSSFGCSTISVQTPEGRGIFGRNFDWGACTALIVQTNPPDGYASISTVNMDFLDLGLDMSEELQMRLLSAAAPYRVSKHNFDSVFASTEWSIVFDQYSGDVRYYHRENYQNYYSFTVGGKME